MDEIRLELFLILKCDKKLSVPHVLLKIQEW